MKKTRLVGLLLSMMTFCASVLAGCGLITVNRNNYLNQVVVSIVEKDTKQQIKIYKKDLINGYEDYGGYYSQSGQTSAEDIYENILDLLINRRIIVSECEKLIENGTIAQDEKAIEKGKTYVYQQTLKAIENRYDLYLNQLLGNSDSSNSASDDRVFKQYTPSAILKDENTIQRLNIEKGVLDDFTYTTARDLDKKEDKEILRTVFKEYVKNGQNDPSTRDKALNNYVDALRKKEDGLNLSRETDSVLMREIERFYQTEYDNFRISQYEDYLRDLSGQNDEYLKDVTVSDVLDLYSSKVRTARANFLIEGQSYEDSMKSDAGSVYYFMEDKDYENGEKATQFFQVAHILFKFSDEVDKNGKTAADKYKELKERQDKESESYIAEMRDLIASVKPVLREYKNGELTETTLETNAWDKAVEIKNEINACQDTNILSDGSKFAKFRDYIYKYNDDPGQLTNVTGGMNYAIGVNYSQPTDDAPYTIYSSFVDEFNDAAIALFDGGDGKIGAVSDPILSENGIHLLIYLGPIKNIFEGITGSFGLNNVPDNDGIYPITLLTQSYQNPFYERSTFDIIYDELATDYFSEYEQNAIENLTGHYNIEKQKSHYQDLFDE